jgi:hypothetical protein
MNFSTVDEHLSGKLTSQIHREKFDPTNSRHKEAYANWVVNGKWSINFEIEWPLVTVPQTVLTKLANHLCSEEINKLQKKKIALVKSFAKKKRVTNASKD